MVQHIIRILVIIMVSSPCLAQQVGASPLITPKHYVCPFIEGEITIDGIIDDASWDAIPWTSDFVDIEGNEHNRPDHRTRTKICWDKNYLYIAAELQEDHIWATLTERDDHIYLDNAFEVFIDTDGNGHNYMELQVNAHNAIWDLYMRHPYGIDKSANVISGWQADGLTHAVHINGTLNDPSDIDDSWTIEMAIPIKVLQDFDRWPTRLWRINFFRVDWPIDIVDGAYERPPIDHDDNKIADYTAWTPSGVYHTHRPDRFGYVVLANDTSAQFRLYPDEKIKTALWDIYYQLKDCLYEHEALSCSLTDFSIPDVNVAGYEFNPQLNYNFVGYDLYATSSTGHQILVINEKGLLQTKRIKNIKR